jgi:hypothetical protein
MFHDGFVFPNRKNAHGGIGSQPKNKAEKSLKKK